MGTGRVRGSSRVATAGRSRGETDEGAKSQPALSTSHGLQSACTRLRPDFCNKAVAAHDDSLHAVHIRLIACVGTAQKSSPAATLAGLP